MAPFFGQLGQLTRFVSAIAFARERMSGQLCFGFTDRILRFMRIKPIGVIQLVKQGIDETQLYRNLICLRILIPLACARTPSNNMYVWGAVFSSCGSTEKQALDTLVLKHREFAQRTRLNRLLIAIFIRIRRDNLDLG